MISIKENLKEENRKPAHGAIRRQVFPVFRIFCIFVFAALHGSYYSLYLSLHLITTFIKEKH